MNSLKFKLISNNSTIIDKETNYYIKDNVIKFKIEDTLYEYDTNNDFIIKKDSNSILKIEMLKNNIVITLLPNNLSFDMYIFVEEHKKNKNSLYLKYTFINDEKTTNCIFIDY